MFNGEFIGFSVMLASGYDWVFEVPGLNPDNRENISMACKLTLKNIFGQSMMMSKKPGFKVIKFPGVIPGNLSTKLYLKRKLAE